MSRRGFVALAGASLLPLALTACGKDEAGSDFPNKTIRIMVPAAPKGGWDTTGRKIQSALEGSKISSESVEVYNVEGPAGTTGLAEFVNKHQGDPHELMVTGLVMVGGIVAHASPVGLAQITPIATLTAEQEVFVVPKDSPYETLADLMDAVVADPKSVSFGGGSAGGTDHILVGLVAEAAGADKSVAKDKYVAYSGGGDSIAALLSGDLDVGVSGVSEYFELVANGDMRALAVSGPKGVDAGAGEPAPTMKEAGYDVELLNWRGIVSPPGITDKDRDAVIAMFDELHESKEWKDILKEQGWDDFYQTGDDAKKYFDDENEKATEVLEGIDLAG